MSEQEGVLVAPACNLSTQGSEGGISEIQGYLLLPMGLKASLDYTGPYLKTQSKANKEEAYGLYGHGEGHI